MSGVETVFFIQHLVTSICQGLQTGDIACCARVRRAWNIAFTYELYWHQEVTDQKYKDWPLGDDWTIPQSFIPSLCRHKSSFSAVSANSPEFLSFLVHQSISTLTRLTSKNRFMNIPSVTKILENNVDSLEELTLIRVRRQDVFEFSRLVKGGMAPLKHLTRLTFYCVSTTNPLPTTMLDTLLTHLPLQLETLDAAVYEPTQRIPESEQAEAAALSIPARPYTALRSVKFDLNLLYCVKNHFLWFLRQCSNLKDLHLACTSFDSGILFATAQKLLENNGNPCDGSTGGLPYLESFSVSGGRWSDSVACLNAISSPLKFLSISQGSGPRMSQVLDMLHRHRGSLEVLTLNRVQGSNEEMRSVFQLFPRLRVYRTNTVYNNRANAPPLHLTIADLSPWACFQSLTILQIELVSKGDEQDQPPSLDPAALSLYPLARSETLQLYLHFSNLIALEWLQVTITDMAPSLEEESTASSITPAPPPYRRLGFEYSLESGLPILNSLKRLKTLTFGPPWTHPSAHDCRIRQQEIEWIEKHWPRLAQIRMAKGKSLKLDQVSQAELDLRAACLWLEERRPDFKLQYKMPFVELPEPTY
ncbi:hypothetical protein EMPS_01597 [Entomortierella parvispora]|uniref:F-box domain-containing protein n=1 Tax=Entomortierella parvispora TaxID=205924 RepID=A0A9P3LSP9_9FUNG|nr:hypothetical protein EMPS_01597 [Entomortierella parvispora]